MFDVKTIKKKLKINDIKKVMNALNIPVFRETEKEIIYYSGDKNKDALSGSPKLFFYKSNFLFCSYTGGYSGDIFTIVTKRKKLFGEAYTFYEAIEYVLDVTGIEVSKTFKTKSKNICDWSGLEKFVKLKHGESVLKVYDDTILNQLETLYPIKWLEEGISIQTMEKYGIKWYRGNQCACIPCRNKHGELIGIRTRNFEPTRLEKAKYIPLTLNNGKCFSFPTNSVLFGINYTWAEIERTKTVMIVESEKAVMKLDTWFDEKNIAVGMFGSNLGIARRNQLLKLGVKKVIYICDNDYSNDEEYKDWQKKIRNFIKLWEGFCSVELVFDNLGLLEPKQNATDKTKEVFDLLYAEKEAVL